MKTIKTSSLWMVLSLVQVSGHLFAETPAPQRPPQSIRQERQAWVARFSDWYIGTVGVAMFMGPPEARLSSNYRELIVREKEARKTLAACLEIPVASTRLQIVHALMLDAGQTGNGKCDFENIEDRSYEWAAAIQNKVGYLMDASKDSQERSLFPFPGGMIGFRERLPKTIDPKSHLMELLTTEKWQNSLLSKCGPEVPGVDHMGLFEIVSLTQHLVEDDLEVCALALVDHRETLLAIAPFLSRPPGRK